MRAERVPQRAQAEQGAVIMCIGSSERLKRYRDQCCVVTVNGSVDFYTLFNTAQGIFDRYDAPKMRTRDV